MFDWIKSMTHRAAVTTSTPRTWNQLCLAACMVHRLACLTLANQYKLQYELTTACGVARIWDKGARTDVLRPRRRFGIGWLKNGEGIPRRSVIFVLIYFLVLVLVLVFQLFFSFSVILVFVIFSF